MGLAYATDTTFLKTSNRPTSMLKTH